MVELFPDRVVYAADDAFHAEEVLGHLRCHDVAVVALGHRDEGVHLRHPNPRQHLLVDPVADDAVSAELGRQPPESVGAPMSSTVTSWPSWSSIAASSAPTRPQPMIRTFTGRAPRRRAADDHLAGRVPEDVLRRIAQLDLAQRPCVAGAGEDGVHAALYRLVHDGVTGVAGLEELPGDLEVQRVRHLLGAGEDLLALSGLGAEIGVKGQGPRHFDHVHRVDLPLVALGQDTGQG